MLFGLNLKRRFNSPTPPKKGVIDNNSNNKVNTIKRLADKMTVATITQRNGSVGNGATTNGSMDHVSERTFLTNVYLKNGEKDNKTETK